MDTERKVLEYYDRIIFQTSKQSKKPTVLIWKSDYRLVCQYNRNQFTLWL